MAERSRTYTLTFRTPVGVFTGLGIAGLVDRTVVRDSQDIPCIPGSTVKGRLRFFAERLLLSGSLPEGIDFHGGGNPHCKEPASACTLCRLFGNPSLPAFLRVSQASLQEPWRSLAQKLLRKDGNPVVRSDVEVRPGIAISRVRRSALPDHLFFDEAVPAGLELAGTILYTGEIRKAEEAFLIGAGRLVDALGARKAAGRGALDGGVRILEVTP